MTALATASLFISPLTARNRGVAAIRASGGKLTDFEVNHVVYKGEQGFIVSLFDAKGEACGVLH